MGNLRKVIASISLVAILSTFAVTNAAFASGAFTDSGTGWFATELHNGKAWDVLAKENGVFTNAAAMPYKDIIRADSAKVIFIGAALAEGEALMAGVFTDINTQDFAKYVKGGLSAGVFTSKPKFDPTGLTNRAQAAAMVVRAFGLPAAAPATKVFSDVNISYTGGESWMNNISTAYCYGLAKGVDGKFLPAKNINRAEFAKMVVVASETPAMLTACAVAPGTTVPPVVTPPVVDTSTGDLTVGISADTASADTLPSGATSVQMASWDFTGGDADATLKSLTIHRFGVWTLPTTHQVYLYDGADRLTSGKTVNSTTNTVTFNNLNLDISAGDTSTLTLRMDVGDNSEGKTGEVGFEILNADAVSAGEGEVAGDFPAKGEKFVVSTTPAGTVTIEKNGSITNPKVGEKGVTIAKFRMSAATENADLSEFGLYIGGNVTPDDVQDLKLYVTGKTDPIATVDSLNSKDVAQFVLDTPYRIAKGETKNMWVSASFNTGRSGDTVLAYVDESTDVVAIGDKYGFGMGVTMTAYDGNVDSCASASSADCSYSALEGGDITLSGTSIANRNLAINQNDVTVMKFTIVAATDVTFNNFMLMLDTGATAEAVDANAGLWQDSASDAANFTDIKIKEVGGDHTWGPIDSDVLDSNTTGTNIIDGTDTDQAYYLFTDDLVMAAGESKDFELTLDVANNSALSNETLTAGIYINSSYPEMKDVNNKVLTNSSSLVPTSSYTADTFTTKTNALTIAKSAAVGSATKVIGTNDIPMLALSVGSGEASSTKITSLTLTGYINHDLVDDNAFVEGSDLDTATTKYFNEEILGMNLYKGSISPANKINVSTKSANTDGKVTFDNLSWTIAAGQTETLIVTGNVANNTSYDGDQVKIDIETPSSDVIAEDSNGNTVSTTSTAPNGTTSEAAAYAGITISSGGTIAIDVDTNTASTKIVVAGSTGVELSKIKLTSTQESFTADKISLQNTSSAYDDNISALKVRYYTDAAQTVSATTTCASSSTAGVYTCSGMNMYIPDPNLTATPNFAVLTVLADLASTANSQADEGDLPGFSVYFAGDFEATGVGSSTKVREENLSFTDLTSNTNISTQLDALVDGAVASASTTSITVDDRDSADTDITASEIVVGDVLCISANATSACATDGDELVFVTAVTDNGAADSTLTVTRGYAGSTAAAIADNEYVYLVKSGSDRSSTSSVEVMPTNTLLTLNETLSSATDTTLTVTGGSALLGLAKGDVICISPVAGAACNTTTGEIMYVDSVTNATTIVVKRGWNDTTALTTLVGTDDIYLIRKANNLLMTNFMEVRATNLTLTAPSSRAGSTSATEPVMALTAVANAAEDVTFRQGVAFTTLVNGTGDGTVDNAEATITVDGTSSQSDSGTTMDNDSFYFVTGDSTAYARASFWMYVNDVGADQVTDTVDFTLMTLFTAADATAAGDNSATMVNPVTTPLANSWYFFDVAIPTGTIAADINFGWELDTVATLTNDTGGYETADNVFVDQFKLYNEKLNVDLSLNENWASATPTLAYLKKTDSEGNKTTVATAYVDFDGVTTSKTGQVQFVPVGAFSDIVLHGTNTLTVEMNTTGAITNDSSSVEQLTAKIDLGAYGTAGDVYWYDGAGTINYLGITDTDNITTVSSY